MKRYLLILRVVETVLLVVVLSTARGVVTNPTADGGVVVENWRVPPNISFGPGFQCSFNPSANYFLISSIGLGYLVSLIGTLLQGGKPNRGLCVSSLALAALGLLSFGLEFLRYLADYGLEFVVSLPAILLSIDWAMWGLLPGELRSHSEISAP